MDKFGVFYCLKIIKLCASIAGNVSDLCANIVIVERTRASNVFSERQPLFSQNIAQYFKL